MRLRMLVFLICLLIFVTNIAAEELPVICLSQGINEIVLSITNNWTNDTVELETAIDHQKLPQWLSVTGPDKKIKVESMEKNKIVFLFDIDSSPGYTIEQVPLLIKDDVGNQWNFNFLVKVTDDSLPQAINAQQETIQKISQENIHDIRTQLTIYNSLGQTVRTLINENQSAGLHIVQWDSRDDQGLKVPSGVYFYMLKAGNYVDIKKMILLQ
ncbi:FlgD immunoglobulin-like domain containing protein [Candidatus Latescibacterota bacterium]